MMVILQPRKRHVSEEVRNYAALKKVVCFFPAVFMSESI